MRLIATNQLGTRVASADVMKGAGADGGGGILFFFFFGLLNFEAEAAGGARCVRNGAALTRGRRNHVFLGGVRHKDPQRSF